MRPRPAYSAKSSAYRVPKSLPLPDAGALPAPSQSIQFDSGAAPSHCVDDAPVPHMNPSGQPIARNLRRLTRRADEGVNDRRDRDVTGAAALHARGRVPHRRTAQLAFDDLDDARGDRGSDPEPLVAAEHLGE